jgi:hypothetical protein
MHVNRYDKLVGWVESGLYRAMCVTPNLYVDRGSHGVPCCIDTPRLYDVPGHIFLLGRTITYDVWKPQNTPSHRPTRVSLILVRVVPRCESSKVATPLMENLVSRRTTVREIDQGRLRPTNRRCSDSAITDSALRVRLLTAFRGDVVAASHIFKVEPIVSVLHRIDKSAVFVIVSCPDARGLSGYANKDESILDCEQTEKACQIPVPECVDAQNLLCPRSEVNAGSLQTTSLVGGE